uniref:Uncharacterized protein n=1 Tax=Anopheles dirus TaxID=7168 RepID=A0A182NWH1_9DIPT
PPFIGCCCESARATVPFSVGTRSGADTVVCACMWQRPSSDASRKRRIAPAEGVCAVCSIVFLRLLAVACPKCVRGRGRFSCVQHWELRQCPRAKCVQVC